MRISIIIPIYNVAPYLRECLGSIAKAIEQCKSESVKCKVEDVEVICVDDCSTDGSYEILKELSTTVHFTLKLLRFPENQGVSAARNRGLEAASGDWVLFLDGDDKLLIERVERLADAVDANPEAELILFGMKMFDETGIVGTRGTDNIYSVAFFQAAYRRSRFKDVRFPAYKVGEDLVYLLRCSRRARSIATTDGVVYLYRQRPGSVMKSKWTRRKRWDDLRHVVHCLGILLVSRGVPLRIYARYVRRIFEKALTLVKP